MIIGVISGTILAANLETKSLVLFFSIIVYLLGFYLIFLKEKSEIIKINFTLIPRIVLGFYQDLFQLPWV